MERVEAAYQAGVAEAEHDIAAGQPRLRYGARGAWGEDLARTLRARFGVELIVLSCLTDDELSSFEAGYNRTVEAHIDSVWGPGSVAEVWAEIQRRRKEGYDAWVASDEGQTFARLQEANRQSALDCSYCKGSGDCFCKRKAAHGSNHCARCNGSGKCHVCKGTGTRGE